MNFAQIDPYQKMTKHELFQLFWFEKMIIYNMNANFDYINDFHVTESLINQFNMTMILPIKDEGNIRYYLSQQGLLSINDVDVKNILLTLQSLSKTSFIDAYFFGDNNIKQFSVYYVELLNYFSYNYETDYHFKSKPVIWDISRKHNAYTIMQLECGAIMETFVDDTFKKSGVDIGFYYDPAGQNKGENSAGIEIKHDMMSEMTGNYYIEICENHRGISHTFVPSGILKNDNTTFWLIGTPSEYCIVMKEDLKRLLYSMNVNDENWQNEMKFVSTASSKGFIIKKDKLQEIVVAKNIEDFVNKFFTHARVAA